MSESISSSATQATVDPTGGDWATYRRLLTYVSPYWWLMLLSIVGFLAAASAEAYFAKLFGDLIDSWDEARLRAAVSIPLLMFAAALVRAVGTIIGEALISRVSFNVVFNLRQDLFTQLLRLPSRYFDNNNQGHIVSRVTFTVAQLRDTGTDALKAIIQDGLKVFVYLGAMLWLNWQMTLLFIGTMPLLALVVVFASSRFRRISRRIQNSMGDVTHRVSETVAGYRVVRSFGGEAQERDRFHQASRVNRQQNLKMAVTKVFSTQLNETIVALALCVLIMLLYDAPGGLTSGQAVTFLSWAGLLGRPIRKLSEVNAKLQRGLAAAEDVFGQLDEADEIDHGDAVVERVRGQLTFEQVAFQYVPDTWVLQDINLLIEPGQSVALVGRSGSGKSTLASLIPRFYELDVGRILLDGVDIRDYQLHSLRQQIALVSQQVTLFNDTLRNNIAYGDLAEKTEEQIRQAIAGAHADEFIDKLPQGLDTLVGDNGVLLSGGQRQRIAIARALLKNAPILILDEATSALDNESERHIQAALATVMEGRTTIVIAHRLSTIESADAIVVMDQGTIAEVGAHTELLAHGGLYADLHSAQFTEEEPATAVTPVAVPKVATVVGPQPTDFLGRSADSLSRAWYGAAWWLHLLRPVAAVFNWLRQRRRRPYLTGQLTAGRTRLPVVVVGNITVGGTGKTPLVGWLVEMLREQGFRPGVIARGYGGRLSKTGSLVPSGADPQRYSDEAVQLRDRLECPVAICADRLKALRLLETQSCDVAISDDGLQHYAMARDIEIAVVDGERGIGNGLLLPAGPLREPVARLQEVDLVVSNGAASGLVEHEYVMRVEAEAFFNVATGERVACADFALHCPQVHAICGIGNPNRFYQSLRALTDVVSERAFADHYNFSGTEMSYGDGLPVVCTEKDAAKLHHLEGDFSRVWFLRVGVEMPDKVRYQLLQLMAQRGITPDPALHEVVGSG